MRYVAADPAAPAMSVVELERFLRSGKKLMRLAFLDLKGQPQIRPLWFLYKKPHLIAVISKGSPLHRALQRRSSIYISVDEKKNNMSRGVRGKGDAKIRTGAASVTRYIAEVNARYMKGKSNPLALDLLRRADSGELVSLEIIPKYLASWDFHSVHEVRTKPHAAGARRTA